MKALQCDVCGKFVSEKVARKWVKVKVSPQKEKSEYIYFRKTEVDLCFECAEKLLFELIQPKLISARV